MIKTTTMTTIVDVEKFFNRSYKVSVVLEGGVWKFHDKWTGKDYESDSLDDILRDSEDRRRTLRNETIDKLIKAIDGTGCEWQEEPGAVAAYSDDNARLLAHAVCVRKGAYTVQLYQLPAFLSAPIAASDKSHFRGILRAVQQEHYSPMEDLVPELRKAFAEFAKQL